MAEQDTTETQTPAPEAKPAKAVAKAKESQAPAPEDLAAEETGLEARLKEIRSKRNAEELERLAAPAPTLAECNAQARAADEASRAQRIDVQEALARLGVKGQVPVRPPTFPVDQQVR